MKVPIEAKPPTVIQMVDINQINVLDAENVAIYIESIGMVKINGKNNDVNSG